ncbi:MAG: hypothetical protein AAGU78_15750 [Chloroflexota bacterium]|jgi:hypothetical protein
MTDDYSPRTGALLALIGLLASALGFIIFVAIYNHMIQVELDAGRPDEANVVRYVFPLLGYLIAAATALWAVSFYGFLIGQKWAWMVGIIAATLSLLCSFFPMIPAASRDETPYMALVFVPSLLLWIGLVWLRKVPRRPAVLAFVAGLAYILSFMDGVAAVDKIQIVHDDIIQGLYVMVQQVNWWACAGWAVFIFALLGRKSWAQPLGIGAAFMACFGGYPIAVESMIDKGTFSMFAPAPLLSTALLVYLVLPATREWMARWARGEDDPALAGKVSRPAYAGK